MNCARVEGLISSHLEGRLTSRLDATVSQHLSACPACRRVAEAILAAERELREEFPPAPPSGIEARAVQIWLAEGAGARRQPSRLMATFAAPLPPAAGHRLRVQRLVFTALLLLAILILEVPAASGRDRAVSRRVATLAGNASTLKTGWELR